MLNFKIEQIAIAPPDPAAAQELLSAMGAVEWAKDHVTASGEVFGVAGSNQADLAFNYDMFTPKREFEILHYTEGPNWLMHGNRWFSGSVSHLGMHCSPEELIEWRRFFAGRGIPVAQEVFTERHTNPVIDGNRWYNYVIFDTKAILGVDLKFIVRLSQPGGKCEK
jgi:hypothetical protein